MTLKVLFNCSTNVGGGSVQNSVNFIKEIRKSFADYDIEWSFVLSVSVYSQVFELIQENDLCLVVGSPAQSILNRVRISRFVNKKINPDVVYTNAGPAYVDFEAFHIMGCSNPFLLGYKDYSHTSTSSLVKVLTRKLRTIYQRYYILKADTFIVQTSYSKSKLIDLGVKDEKIHVIHNSVSKDFFVSAHRSHLASSDKKLNIETKFAWRVLIPSAYYPHKMLDFATDFTEYANRSFPKKIFYFTLPPRIFKIYIKSRPSYDPRWIRNIGPYDHKNAARIYSSMDFVFLPSGLEVFSTSYIEALVSGNRLIVPDLPFVRDICLSEANYFKAYDFNSVLNAFELGGRLNNEEIIKRQKSVISRYGTQTERVGAIISYILSKGVNNV